MGRTKECPVLIPLLYRNERIADGQLAGAMVDEVLAEEDLVVLRAVFGKGSEGFPAFFGGELVNGGHDAAGAEFHAVETDIPDGEILEPVLLEGGAAGEDDIGAKAVHGKRLVETAVEFFEAGFADEEEGVGIGKGGVVAFFCIVKIGLAIAVIGHVDEAAFDLQQLAEPGVGVWVDELSADRVIPALNVGVIVC